jgi:hypothetical protein
LIEQFVKGHQTDTEEADHMGSAESLAQAVREGKEAPAEEKKEVPLTRIDAGKATAISQGLLTAVASESVEQAESVLSSVWRNDDDSQKISVVDCNLMRGQLGSELLDTVLSKLKPKSPDSGIAFVSSVLKFYSNEALQKMRYNLVLPLVEIFDDRETMLRVIQENNLVKPLISKSKRMAATAKALTSQRFGTLNALLDAGYELPRKLHDGELVLDILMEKGTEKHFRAVDFFVETTDINAPGPEDGFTCLDKAISLSNETMANYLMNEKKLKPSAFGEKLLSTDTWKFFGKLQAAFKQANFDLCIELLKQDPHLAGFADIRGKNLFLNYLEGYNRGNGAERVIRHILDNGGLFIYPAYTWTVEQRTALYKSSTYDRKLSQEVFEAQFKLIMFTFLSGKVSPGCLTHKFLQTCPSDLLQVIFEFSNTFIGSLADKKVKNMNIWW